ncbi:hypothetical protein MMC28_001156 [Mycoblastus sanguinarius]|nr:hypothetical protein [Mycoblastus sanguinarius]
MDDDVRVRSSQRKKAKKTENKDENGDLRPAKSYRTKKTEGKGNSETKKSLGPKKRRQENSEGPADPVETCRQKGLSGSPTYDEHGFELDKEYIIKRTSNRAPTRSEAWGKKAEAHWDLKKKEDERIGEMMGVPFTQQSPLHHFAWDDRVARDLGIAFHEVGMEEYEEWHKRGFVFPKEEFGAFWDSEEERNRVTKLATGSAFRKGSKRR